jgi:hypothetical protein
MTRNVFFIIIGIILCIILYQSSTSSVEKFTNYSEVDKGKIHIVFNGKIKPWIHMYNSYYTKDIHILTRPSNNNHSSTISGYINSPAFLGLDNKDNFSRFMVNNNLSYHPKTCVCSKGKLETPLPYEEDVYFVKNTSDVSYGGKGIEIFNNTKDVKKYVKSHPEYNYVIQKNIKNPLLYDGRKGDFRFYLLLTLVEGKLNVFIYKDGFLKQAPGKYDPSTIDRTIMLTNNTQRGKEKSLDNKLISELPDNHIITSKSRSVLKDFSLRLKDLIDKTVEDKSKLQLHILGPDLLFDKDYKPYLLELNIINPAYMLRNNNFKIKLLKFGIGEDIINNFLLSYMKKGHFNMEKSDFIKLI